MSTDNPKRSPAFSSCFCMAAHTMSGKSGFAAFLLIMLDL